MKLRSFTDSCMSNTLLAWQWTLSAVHLEGLTEDLDLAAQAIFHLATPWAAVEKAQGLKQVLGRGAAEEMLRRPERLLREFRMGEERVRHIVLGSPLAPKLATTPPAWARSASRLACTTLHHWPGEYPGPPACTLPPCLNKIKNVHLSPFHLLPAPSTSEASILVPREL